MPQSNFFFYFSDSKTLHMSKKEKNRVGVVYSTNSDFDYSYDETEQPDTLPPDKQRLRVYLDTKQRAGKKVTLIEQFVGKTEDLEALCKLLKTKLGTGGSTKDGYIVIQGDVVQKTKELLQSLSYKIK